MATELERWMQTFLLTAYIDKDERVRELAKVFSSGVTALQAMQHNEALHQFDKGVAMAQLIPQPCWQLLFEYIGAEIVISLNRNFREGLDRGIRMVTLAHKDELTNCFIRSGGYFTLIYVYSSLDGIGYQDKIQEMSDYMRREIKMDQDTVQRLHQVEGFIAYMLRDYDTAESIVQQYADPSYDETRQLTAYYLLHKIAYARGQLEIGYAYIQQVEQYARAVTVVHASVAEALFWKAIYAYRLGEHDRAITLQTQANDYKNLHDVSMTPELYDAIGGYQQTIGNYDEAIRIREVQIQNLSEVSSVAYTAETHLSYLRLLGQADQDITPALKQAYLVANDLLKPQYYLDQLQKIEQGDYYAFDWQRPSS